MMTLFLPIPGLKKGVENTNVFVWNRVRIGETGNIPPLPATPAKPTFIKWSRWNLWAIWQILMLWKIKSLYQTLLKKFILQQIS